MPCEGIPYPCASFRAADWPVWYFISVSRHTSNTYLTAACTFKAFRPASTIISIYLALADFASGFRSDLLEAG